MPTKDYSKYSKEDLIKLIKNLEKHRYGLVWEDKQEEVAERCSKELPVLVEDKSKEIITDKSQPTNILIEGDNYHALYTLNFTHKKKVDVIYIDPPYNTGAKDWKYNNDYVDSNDTYRHSKWLSFMAKRLRLAKNLLKPNSGVLICTIDENENAALGLLLQKLFPSYEIVGVIIVHNPAGVQGKNFSYTHEIAYFVYPQNYKCIGTTSREKELVSPLRDWGGTSARKLAKNCFYPIIIRDNKVIGFGEVCPDDFHPKAANVLRKNGEYYIYPIDKHGLERKWVYSRVSAEKNAEQLFVKKVDSEYVIMRRKNVFTHRTVWDNKRYYANIYGSKLLNNLISAKFSFPKSLYAVEDCIQAVIHDKDSAVILDFFAGSGTTAHAILELNKKDNGSRQFILCTNNENNICSDVCYPRIKKVIHGYNEDKSNGLGGNLKYFKTAFVPQVLTDNDKRVLVARSTELLCLAESTFDPVKQNKNDFAVFENSQQYTAIIYDEDSLSKCKKAMKKLDGSKPVCIYIFSYDHTYNEEDFKDLLNVVKIKPIPEAILNVYRKIAKYKKK